MRLRHLLPVAAALALGAGGMIAATPVSAASGDPADCVSNLYTDSTGTGYATIFCGGPIHWPNYRGYVVCQPHGTRNVALQYALYKTFPILVETTIRCNAYDTAVSADAVQA